jgi:hypothetical protein
MGVDDMTYEDRSCRIGTEAWNQWTQGRVNMDNDMLRETTNTVIDAVNNTYYTGISDAAWLEQTMKRLEGVV